MINAWSRSDTPLKAQRAFVLVQDMISRYNAGDMSLKPDVFVYTILIKACAHIQGTQQEKQTGLYMSLDAMQILEDTDFGPPNDVAYGAFMMAICRLSDSTHQRETLLEAAFRKCSNRGLVSRNVVDEMNRGGSRRLFRRLTNNTNQLKSDWSKNVDSRNMPHSGY